VKVLTIHGPNLNLLGSRQVGIYGSDTLASIDNRLRALAAELKLEIECMQSNHEGALVDAIQKAKADGVDGFLINPAAYGHTSVALRDALLATNLPFVEVHISNTFAREPFRQKSLLSDVASGVVIGFGAESYLLGLRGLANRLLPKH
jgi:3-dehydroquinate dehydratase-2